MFIRITLQFLSYQIPGARPLSTRYQIPGARPLSTRMSASISSQIVVSDAFDSGNILRVADDVSKPSTVLVHIKDDVFTELEQVNHKQWFYFKANFASPLTEATRVTYSISNANKAAFPTAWPGTTVCYSFDRRNWLRAVSTNYDKEAGVLDWSFNHKAGSRGVYFAYFPPFTYEQHLELIEKCSESPVADVLVLGQSLQGRPIECVKVGTGSKKAWIIHRQHPGETQAEYFAKGLLQRLLGIGDQGSVDGMAKNALKEFTFFVVPNMCPDGSVLGHLRTNACGANLNREWADSTDKDYQAPTLERSPEVFCVLNKMIETGVDAFCDVHGDEEFPYNFIAGAEGVRHWGPRMKGLQGAFLAAYERANSDIQKQYSYDPDDANGAKLSICSNQIADRFDCLAVTLEMPYKDCSTNPDPTRGWSTGRCEKLGASLVDGFMHVKDWLRTEDKFWLSLDARDAYVRPVEPENIFPCKE